MDRVKALATPSSSIWRRSLRKTSSAPSYPPSNFTRTADPDSSSPAQAGPSALFADTSRPSVSAAPRKSSRTPARPAPPAAPSRFPSDPLLPARPAPAAAVPRPPPSPGSRSAWPIPASASPPSPTKKFFNRFSRPRASSTRWDWGQRRPWPRPAARRRYSTPEQAGPDNGESAAALPGGVARRKILAVELPISEVRQAIRRRGGG